MQKTPEEEKHKRITSKEKKKLPIIIFLWSTFFALSMFILLGVAFVLWLRFSFLSPGPLTIDREVHIGRGSGLKTISKQLKKENIIRYSWVFEWEVRLQQGEASLQAGNYKIKAQASMQEVYQTLREGRVVSVSITIPEGENSKEVFNRLNQHPLLQKSEREIPKEGTLLPDTYQVQSGSSVDSILDRMRAAQQKHIAVLWQKAQERELPLKTAQEMIVLASIIEKEAGTPQERRHIASVFINRLKRGMKLESDPTVIYGITKGESLKRGLYQSELRKKTEWNTYRIKGLPITAICNPGIASLKAVVNPLNTKDLYFVANGRGGHFFSSTYSQHLRNVRKWRKIEKSIRNKK